MPTNNQISKADSTKPFRVDDRVTVGRPLTPYSANSYDGPTRTVVSGIRVNVASGN